MENPQNRRQWARSSHVACSVIVAIRNSYAGVFVSENLSAGGALLVGAHRFSVGDYLSLVLQFGATLKVGVAGKVVRVDVGPKGKHVLGVEFQEVPTSLRETLNEIVCATLDPDQKDHVTLIVRAGDVANELERDLAALGRKIVVLADLRRATRWLETRPHPIVAAAVIGGDPDQAAATLELISDEAPAARRIALADGTEASPTLDALLARGAAHAVLRRGWNLLSLSAAVIVSPAADEDLKSTRAASRSLLS
jgi:hypothetical protein